MGQSNAPYIFMIYRMLVFLIFGISLDQGVKFIIRDSMSVGSSIPLIDDVFHITYVQNTGASFGIFGEHTSVLTAITAVVLAVLLAYIVHLSKKFSTANIEGVELKLKKVYIYSLLCIVAGGIGNDIDRVMRGCVVDFLDFRIWPVFNIADIFICAGCILLILYVVILEPKYEKNKKEYTDEGI